MVITRKLYGETTAERWAAEMGGRDGVAEERAGGHNRTGKREHNKGEKEGGTGTADKKTKWKVKTQKNLQI